MGAIDSFLFVCLVSSCLPETEVHVFFLYFSCGALLEECSMFPEPPLRLSRIKEKEKLRHLFAPWRDLGLSAHARVINIERKKNNVK